MTSGDGNLDARRLVSGGMTALPGPLGTESTEIFRVYTD